MKPTFKIFRYDPEKDPGPYYRYYTVEVEPEARILDALNKIRWEQDGTLAYRMSCGHGVCGSDGMRINGTCGLACQKLIKDYQCPEIVLEPLPVFRVLKDLLVDMDSFLEGIHAVRPYLITSATGKQEILQDPEDRKKVDEVIRCILCACCTAGCPVMGHNKDYVGPAAVVWMYRYIFDSRDEDTEARLRQADDPNGVWPCVGHFECTRVCPKEIPITRSINRLKKRIKGELGDGGEGS
jgi:succinate dehydrogenase / fumarate reductase iron-sulfur subunit